MDRIRELIEEIREYGEKNNIPIMSKETIEVIFNIITEVNISSILEIGTAIGYSTICFANNKSVKNITSIERDNIRYSIAVKNIDKSNLTNIKLINDDAFNVNFNDKFDLIIIDAAKAQNEKFFKKFKNNLNERGIIIIDNLRFHGLVGKGSEIKSRNLKGLVTKIEKFIKFLDSQDEFEVKYLEVGDKIAICKKKNL